MNNPKLECQKCGNDEEFISNLIMCHRFIKKTSGVYSKNIEHSDEPYMIYCDNCQNEVISPKDISTLKITE